MLILTIRTDKPDAEIGLYHDSEQLRYESWTAHRQLAETLHQKIAGLLTLEQKTIGDLEGIVCFEGPGSFTGLRIGLSVGNALSYGLAMPIAGAQGDAWKEDGIDRLLAGENDTAVLPFYGAPVHITEQKK